MNKKEIFAENETRKFDITKGCENMYIEEMKYFLELVKTRPKAYNNTKEEALESLRIALL